MKHIVIIRYVLMALCVVVIVLGLATDNVDLLLRWLYVMMGLSIAAIVLFSIYAMAQNPKSAVKSLIGLAAILVLFGVAFALSSDVPVVTPTKTYSNSLGLKVADASLYATYILLVGAILAIIGGEVRNFFK